MVVGVEAEKPREKSLNIGGGERNDRGRSKDSEAKGAPPWPNRIHATSLVGLPVRGGLVVVLEVPAQVGKELLTSLDKAWLRSTLNRTDDARHSLPFQK
jgi:hypothetical protein